MLERDVYKKYLGVHLRNKRIELDLTQDELEEKAGLSETMISKIENNERLPSSYTLYLITSAMGISIDQLNQDIARSIHEETNEPT
ncbi:helix-turn-helix transcriptional regulator [Rossellomorea marisflavi]|uniref:helix-turn-helix domain-containing protein n=1 Tax=Rossellomorea marisflavi TaxID=189381 RepID=UPI0013173FBC|nr:helix-turn-helix transcriptional regulator [Rossellomorea marisflavi]QHA35192.1 helix-turn-helix domain-containing protein [Rossellomorea marisflavi]WJV18107.1 helix-turn-helix transcriptional regulator [Rossellomorea marisflavi]